MRFLIFNNQTSTNAERAKLSDKCVTTISLSATLSLRVCTWQTSSFIAIVAVGRHHVLCTMSPFSQEILLDQRAPTHTNHDPSSWFPQGNHAHSPISVSSSTFRLVLTGVIALNFADCWGKW